MTDYGIWYVVKMTLRDQYGDEVPDGWDVTKGLQAVIDELEIRHGTAYFVK